ncbi:hypothetical protein [Streptomyces sp. NPDC048411]|uniref:hypothetical protein n=1 Tax=Streptomyces sp. NPDC048411 TaxID=3157206 RepID=UPI0034546621
MRKIAQIAALAAVTAATALTTTGTAEAATESISNHCTTSVAVRSSYSTSAAINGYCYTRSVVTSDCYMVGTSIFGNPYWDKSHVATRDYVGDPVYYTNGWISEYYLSNKNAPHC